MGGRTSHTCSFVYPTRDRLVDKNLQRNILKILHSTTLSRSLSNVIESGSIVTRRYNIIIIIISVFSRTYARQHVLFEFNAWSVVFSVRSSIIVLPAGRRQLLAFIYGLGKSRTSIPHNSDPLETTKT